MFMCVKMEKVRSSRITVSTHQTVWCHIPEYCNVNWFELMCSTVRNTEKALSIEKMLT